MQFQEIVIILNSLFVKWSPYWSKIFLSSHLAIADRGGHELIRCSRTGSFFRVKISGRNEKYNFIFILFIHFIQLQIIIIVIVIIVLGHHHYLPYCSITILLFVINTIDIRELMQATFLSRGRKPEVNISHTRTVVSLWFSSKSSLLVKR